MDPSELLLQSKLRGLDSDKEAFEEFFNYCQERIYLRGATLLEAYSKSQMWEPWKTIAYAHQIWGSISHNGIYQYLEDDSARAFDSVLESALNLLGLSGFEVIADYRKRVADDPNFWKREWRDHTFVYHPDTMPKLPRTEDAEKVWKQYRDLFGRFWDATRDFEIKAGAFLRAE